MSCMERDDTKGTPQDIELFRVMLNDAPVPKDAKPMDLIVTVDGVNHSFSTEHVHLVIKLERDERGFATSLQTTDLSDILGTLLIEHPPSWGEDSPES